ncbi:MAG: HDOD domain-containing protein [Pseudomonadota bacterium]
MSGPNSTDPTPDEDFDLENLELELAQQEKPTPRVPAFEFIRQLGENLAEGDFELPPFPDTAVRVQQCVNDPDSTVTELAAIVASEPTLAARLLRMSNSAMMRRGPIEVTDIPTAISRVGMDMVQNLFVSYAAREAFQCPEGSASMEELNSLRSHSVKVATVSYALGKYCPFGGKPEEAMLAGLLHAVGKFYIYMRAAEYPALFQDRATLDGIVSQWHTGVARAIVESWEFPASVAHGVDEQEVKARHRAGAADLSDILFLANLLSRAGFRAAEQLGDLDALARLRTTPEGLAALLEDHGEEIESMIEALSV